MINNGQSRWSQSRWSQSRWSQSRPDQIGWVKANQFKPLKQLN
jgi:hypothetical protein